jgi:FkbM family methyltransferase
MNLSIQPNHSLEKLSIDLCREILSGDFKIYLFGQNDLSAELIDQIKIDGVIDEYVEDHFFHKIKVIKNLNEIGISDSIVVSCIIGKPWLVKEKMDLVGLKNIDYFSFWKYSGLVLKDYRNWNQFKHQFEEKAYISIYEKLQDLESKRTLENLINFRLTLDISFLKFYTDRQFYQYFENFLLLNSEVFFDIGGFDGHTSLQFIKSSSKLSKIYFFEPDQNNLIKAKKALSEYSQYIQFNSFGLNDKQASFLFKNDGSKSSISESGDVIVELQALDKILLDEQEIHRNGAFLKMDIEGWELNALKGAERFIINHRPKLAICVYHKSNDMIDISSYILSLHKDYRLFLRHYTEGVDETVMYFIP